MKTVKSLKRIQNLSTILKDNPVVVQPDPSIVSADMMPNFEIIDEKSMHKKANNPNLNQKEEMLEAQMIKLSDFNFLKAINKSSLLRIKKKLPEKAACYNLRKKDILNNHISAFKAGEDHKQQPIVYDDFKKYYYNFDKNKNKHSKEFSENINLTLDDENENPPSLDSSDSSSSVHTEFSNLSDDSQEKQEKEERKYYSKAT